VSCNKRRVGGRFTQEERNDLLQTSGMQQIKEEMSSNAKSFYIRTHKNQRARQRHNKSFIATSCTTVNPQVTDEQRWKRRRTVCYKPRSLKHRGITRNQRMAENYTVGSLALPSMDTKMARMPTYTQNNNSGGTKKVH
jgi:hypothetical protein